jgi:hypothetical protein
MKAALRILFATCITLVCRSVDATDISGNIWGNLSSNGNPYNITGDVIVPQDSNLYIGAGCELIFQGRFGLTVDTGAVLIAEGTITDSVTFTSSDTTAGWNGISMLEPDSVSRLDYCIIKYGKMYFSIEGSGVFCMGKISGITNTLFYANNPALSLLGSSSIIRNNTFINGDIIFANSFLIIENNIFINCGIVNNDPYDSENEQSDLIIKNNQFTGWGIEIELFGGDPSENNSARADIQDNIFSGCFTGIVLSTDGYGQNQISATLKNNILVGDSTAISLYARGRESGWIHGINTVSATMENNVISGCAVGIFLSAYGGLGSAYVRISMNGDSLNGGSGDGINSRTMGYFEQSDLPIRGTIRNVYIGNYGGSGMYFDDSWGNSYYNTNIDADSIKIDNNNVGIKSDYAQLSCNYSQFINNFIYAAYSENREIDATNCYWGMTDSASISNLIFGNVIFMPFLTHPPGCGTISGTITDSDATTPIGNATVRLLRNGIEISADTTETEGIYSFPNINSGTYDLEVSKEYYIPQTQKDVVVNEDVTASTNFNFNLFKGDLFSFINFDDGSVDDWTQIRGSCSWDIQNGVLSTSMNGPNNWCMEAGGDLHWQEFTVDAWIRGNFGVDKMLAFRVKDANNYYAVNLRSLWNGQQWLTMNKMANGQFYADIVHVPYSNTNGVWYHLTVKAVGSLFNVSVNGQHQFDWNDIGAYGNVIYNGGVGLCCYTGENGSDNISFDNVCVYQQGHGEFGTSVDGYGILNYPDEEQYDVQERADFIAAFGYQRVCLPNGQLSKQAETFFESGHLGDQHGLCGGISISSGLFYNGFLPFNTLKLQLGQANWNAVNVNHLSNTPEVEHLLERYHWYWISRERVNFSATIDWDPMECFYEIQHNTLIGNPEVYGLFFVNNPESQNGHMVVARYAERNNPLDLIGFIHIYDSNCPNQDRKISINFSENTWSYENSPYQRRNLTWVPFSIFENGVSLSPASNDDHRSLDIAAGNLCVKYVDEYGNISGCSNDGYQDNISQVFRIDPIGDEGDSTHSEYYSIATGTSLSVSLAASDSGQYSFRRFYNGDLFSVESTLNDSGSVDYLYLPVSSGRFEYATADTIKPCSFTIIRKLADQQGENIFAIGNTTISPGDTTKIQTASDGSSISYMNHGVLKSYNVDFERTGLNAGHLSIDGLTIDSGYVQIISPTDWESLPTSEVVIQIDHGNDGTIDDTVIVANQYYLPGPFSLIAPPAGDTSFMPTTVLAWHPAGNPHPEDSLWYEIYIDTLQNLSAAHIYTASDTVLQLATLQDESNYFWAVKAVKALGPGTWAPDTLDFVVYVPDAPNAYSLAYPPNNGIIPYDTMTLAWQKAYDRDTGDSVHYRLDWSLDSSFVFFDSRIIADTMYFLSDLTGNILVGGSSGNEDSLKIQAIGKGPSNLVRSKILSTNDSNRGEENPGSKNTENIDKNGESGIKKDDGLITSLPDDITIYWRVKAIDRFELETWSSPDSNGWSFDIRIPDPPYITSLDTATATEHLPFRYFATATDPDRTVPTINFCSYASWLQVLGDAIAGIPLEGAQDTSFVVTASDGILIDTMVVALHVIPIDDPPIFTSGDSVVATEHAYFRYVASAYDPEGAASIVGFMAYPHWLTAVGDTISGIPEEGDPDTTMWVIASDSSISDTMTVRIGVIPINDPPIITSPNSIQGTRGVLIIYVATANDPDNAVLAISFTDFPSWMMVRGDTISGTPLNSVQDTTFSVIASDGEFADTILVPVYLQSLCNYVLGDANNSSTFTGLDVTYAVRYFKGGPHPPLTCDCPPHGTWYVAGDVNGSCSFSGLDVTYMVRYFKGGPHPIACPDCPPPGLLKRPIPGNEPIKTPVLKPGGQNNTSH